MKVEEEPMDSDSRFLVCETRLLDITNCIYEAIVQHGNGAIPRWEQGL